MNIKSKIITLLLLVPLLLNAQEVLYSPDGKLCMTFEINSDGTPIYNLT